MITKKDKIKQFYKDWKAYLKSTRLSDIYNDYNRYSEVDLDKHPRDRKKPHYIPYWEFSKLWKQVVSENKVIDISIEEVFAYVDKKKRELKW